MNYKMTILVLFLLKCGAWAAEIVGGGGRLGIEPVRGFRLHENFLGFPYIMIDQGGNKKSSISLTPTGVATAALEDGPLSESYGQYKIGRERWAKKRGHTDLEFDPFASFENSSKAKVVAVGYKYKKKDGTKNLERSFYVYCPREMFHVKILTEDGKKGGNYSAQLRENLQKSSCR